MVVAALRRRLDFRGFTMKKNRPAKPGGFLLSELRREPEPLSREADRSA